MNHANLVQSAGTVDVDAVSDATDCTHWLIVLAHDASKSMTTAGCAATVTNANCTLGDWNCVPLGVLNSCVVTSVFVTKLKPVAAAASDSARNTTLYCTWSC